MGEIVIIEFQLGMCQGIAIKTMGTMRGNQIKKGMVMISISAVRTTTRKELQPYQAE